MDTRRKVVLFSLLMIPVLLIAACAPAAARALIHWG